MANFGIERVYQEFEPVTRWTSEPDAEVLVADLPGFKKEQLKVAVTATRKLRLIGERATGGNKWLRFHKEIPVPLTVDTDSISAMFKDNKLYIRHPKIKTEIPQTKPPSPVKPPVIMKNHDLHERKQGHGQKAMAEKPSGGKNDQLKHVAQQLKHDAQQKARELQNGKKELIGETKGPLDSKDEEKDKVGAKWFEKYKEATGNVVKEAKNKRQLLCNLAASVSLVLLILLYARNAVRSSFVWDTEE
ncbi:PREDICTED: inactive protein RESTRICTED TEV MOVEMENT 2-like isoform X3 [Camelina sativa]|uniref:Inactive protein RESTRICTED TEV MOVEMENT 2-like isoform X3 n=1 Tax=Camelina sativa TaxID=90675 RepID=A0ABM0VD59_CAMSA|nr:PREDICTED: inactive protein RESTRICTED TEV MOVEMENT 2-like isoform X3 [Camelina sativa]